MARSKSRTLVMKLLKRIEKGKQSVADAIAEAVQSGIILGAERERSDVLNKIMDAEETEVFFDESKAALAKLRTQIIAKPLTDHSAQ